MKKFISFIVCIILVLYYVAPFFVGKSAEKEFNSMIKSLEGQLNTKIESKYNRGWFSSTANLSFNVQKAVTKLNPALGENFTDTFLNSDYKINHGFFPFTKNFKNRKPLVPVIAVLKGKVCFSNKFFDKVIQVDSSAVINLDGGLVGTLTFSKNRVFASELDELFVKIIQSQITFSVSKDLDSSTFALDFPKIKISNKDGLIEIENIKISSKILKTKNKLPVGKTKFEIEKIILKDKKNSKNEFDLSNFVLSSSTDEKKDLIFGKFKVAFDKFNMPQETFGPADLEFTYKNFDSKALVKMQNIVNELNINSSQMASVMVLSKLTTLLPELIKKSPEIELTKFKLPTCDGNFSGYFKIKIDGSDFNNFTKIKDDLNKLYIEANFKIPEKFAEGNFLTNNFIKFVKDGGNYKADVLFENGDLIINGKETRLPF